MSGRSYIGATKKTVFLIKAQKLGFFVKFFTKSNTNTKLFDCENAYKFSRSVTLLKISQSIEQFSFDLNLCVAPALQALTKRTNTKQVSAYIPEKFSIFKLFVKNFTNYENSYMNNCSVIHVSSYMNNCSVIHVNAYMNICSYVQVFM